jgi:hypothetical protein
VKFIGGEEMVSGGWRIEKDERRKGVEEWVSFEGWESMEKVMEFLKTEEIKEYVKTKQLAEGCEVRHAVKLEIM